MTVGLSTAEVYRDNGVYSVFLVGDQVACYLGRSTSLEDCQDEIESWKELAKSISNAESPSLVSQEGGDSDNRKGGP